MLLYSTCRKHQIFISRPESLLKRHCKVLHERGLAVGVFPYYIGSGGGWTVVKSAAALEAKKRQKTHLQYRNKEGLYLIDSSPIGNVNDFDEAHVSVQSEAGRSLEKQKLF